MLNAKAINGHENDIERRKINVTLIFVFVGVLFLISSFHFCLRIRNGFSVRFGFFFFASRTMRWTGADFGLFYFSASFFSFQAMYGMTCRPFVSFVYCLLLRWRNNKYIINSKESTRRQEKEREQESASGRSWSFRLKSKGVKEINPRFQQCVKSWRRKFFVAKRTNDEEEGKRWKDFTLINESRCCQYNCVLCLYSLDGKWEKSLDLT